jgi:acyl-CoA synthetase (AMP-forming)/AMP-acid ligase II
MLQGLMQHAPLQISGILTFGDLAHSRREIVSRLVDEPLWRYDYGQLADRARRLAKMLQRLGIEAGDRVSSLAWNTHRHLELFYAVPGIGAVLHTANPRMSEEQISYTINHAGSVAIFFDKTFLPMIERLRPQLATVREFILLSDAHASDPRGAPVEKYETLLGAESDGYEWPTFDENSAAFLCYTSGTTALPKGVLYSHRSVVLHATAAGLSGALGFSAFDCIMPCQSLYHATAWGLPFVALINGCKLVLPCEKMDWASVQELIQHEGVTFSGGVPTIWTMYLAHLERTGEGTGQLERLLIGGSAVPRAMAETFQNRYGVKVRQLWGMTETSPLGVVSTPTPQIQKYGKDAMNELLWTRQGRLQFGIELRVVDNDGCDVPRDGNSFGSLLVRGPWTIERYYGSGETALDANGWFDTGDIATLDDAGFMRITDRKKDLIKSGGEWISSIDLENMAAACPGVRIAAVVGVPHPKWQERPILIVERHAGETVTEQELMAFLQPKFVRWWLPDAVFFAPVPLTAAGKIDKKALRERYEYSLQPSAVRLPGATPGNQA